MRAARSRLRSGLCGLVVAVSVVAPLGWLSPAPPNDARALDPALTWRSLTTRHFRVNYYVGLEPIARRVAAVAERANARLVPALGWHASQRTEIVITDDSDFANGRASALPYNRIHLYVTAPEDMAWLHDYDDWLTSLVTHEYTHVLHMDNISGLPAIINAVFGKVLAPNVIQPSWVLEGLAVYDESAETAGGRLRSSIADMWLRADFLGGHEVSLDQLSNSVARWPWGNIPYLYGARFLEWIAQRYGRDSLRVMAHEYGRSPVPWGINRAIRRATGRTFVDLYEGFRRDMRARYRRQVALVAERGLVEGERLTDHGSEVLTPRWLPDGRVIYAAGGIYRRYGLYAKRPGEAFDARPELLTRLSGDGESTVSRDGRTVVYQQPDVYRRIYYYSDLARLDLRTGESTRLTEGMRAREPDLSPDGRQLAFTVNRRGTTHLYVGDAEDPQRTARRVVASRRFEQIYTPRWSPDGTRIAYSAWLDGGYRDILVLDVATGRRSAITHDRALDQGPCWSPDGRSLYFSSDRTGISNVYVFDLAHRALRQVTNVRGGAYMPAISRDGRMLAYVGYGWQGYDIYTMRLEPARTLEAPPFVDRAPAPVGDPPAPDAVEGAYQPLRTFLPRAYLLGLSSDSFGSALTVRADGGDIVGFHSYSLTTSISLVEGHVGFDLGYGYNRLVFPMRLHLSRTVGSRGGLRIADESRNFREEVWRGDVTFAFPFPANFENHYVELGYDLTYVRSLDAFGGPLDPNTEPPTLPELGWATGVHAAWSYSNVEWYARSISAERGRSIGVRVGLAHPALGGQHRVTTGTYYWNEYIPMPPRGHVLALGLSGGISGGDFNQRSFFSVGGFPEVSLLASLRDQIFLGGNALRGYPPYVRSGDRYQLFNLEYRMPLLQLDHGLSTYPIYVNRIYGSVFTDYGDAWSGRAKLKEFRLGFGAELLLDFTLGYQLGYTMRVGLARGVMDGGITQLYAILGFPY